MEATVNTGTQVMKVTPKVELNSLASDAAKELGISKSELKTLVQKENIQSELKDGHYYVNVGEIQTYLTKLEVEEEASITQYTVSTTEKEKENLLNNYKLNIEKTGSKLTHISVEKPVNSPFNYTGNKEELLPQVFTYFKQNIATFYDVFGGGGIVGLNVEAQDVIYNEYDKNLCGVLENLSKNTVKENYKTINNIIKKYELHIDNKAGYLKLRKKFNESEKKPWELFYALILFSYKNEISYSKKTGKFNKTFGKRHFNKHLKAKFILFTDKLISNQHRMKFQDSSYDFIDTKNFKENDFVYVDPPYWATLQKYGVKWGDNEEKKLLSSLDNLNKKGVDFALSNVIYHKGKANQILIDWAEKNDKYNVIYLNKSYSDQSSNKLDDKSSVEVLITNYKTLNSKEIHEVTMMDTEIVQGRFVVENSIDTNTEVENINKYFNLSEEADKNFLLSMNQALEQKCIGLINKVKVGQGLIIFQENCFAGGKIYKDEFKKQSFEFSLKTANAYMKLARDERITKLTVKDMIKFKRKSLDALHDMTFLTDDEYNLFMNGKYEILKPKRKIAPSRQTTSVKQTDTTVEDTLEVSNTEIATTVKNEVTESNQNQDNANSEDGFQASMPNQSAAQTIAELKATIEKQNVVIEKQRAKIERYERLMLGSSMPKYPAQNNIFPRIEDAS